MVGARPVQRLILDHPNHQWLCATRDAGVETRLDAGISLLDGGPA